MGDTDDDADQMTPRERARLRHRDRKRVTAMVVDNAAVKRTAQALARRAAQRPSPPAASPDAPD